MAEEATFRDLVASFTDFLTVAIHAILYERCIYPRTSFLCARKYNFPVRQNRHPKVCEWINDAVSAVETELLKCTVRLVAVVLYSQDNQPRERYAFDVSRFPNVKPSEVDLPMQRLRDGKSIPVLPSVDMEEQLRAALSRLVNCSGKLKALPEGCTFTVAIELKGPKQAPVKHPQPWMPAEPRLDGGQDGTAKGSVHPVRAVAAGEMMFETWVEEIPTNSGPSQHGSQAVK